MKPTILICGLSILLAGCSVFAPPTAKQSRRNETGARNAEARSAEYEKTDAINARAAAYERQGMSRKDALALAKSEVTAPGH